MTLLGGATISPEWRLERSARRRRERALPPGLRAQVRRVRRDDLAQVILDVIDERVRSEARRCQLPGNATATPAVTPVAARKALRALDSDPTFRGYLRSEINTLLREHHRTKTDPEAPATLPLSLGDGPKITRGVLPLRSSIGLGTGSFLESEPEEWCRYIVSCALARTQSAESESDSTLDDDELRMFVIGAGTGGVARVVTALELSARIEVSEQDHVLPGQNAMPCVTGPRGPTSEKHDVIVMVLPSPAEGGAANHRRLYRSTSEREFDLSTLGLTKWLAHVGCLLAVLPDLLTTSGEIFLLVPTSVRCDSGYRPHEGLLNSVTDAIEAVGLAIVEQANVIEIAPVNQPFVARNRPERWSLRLRRRSSSSPAEVSNA